MYNKGFLLLEIQVIPRWNSNPGDDLGYEESSEREVLDFFGEFEFIHKVVKTLSFLDVISDTMLLPKIDLLCKFVGTPNAFFRTYILILS